MFARLKHAHRTKQFKHFAAEISGSVLSEYYESLCFDLDNTVMETEFLVVDLEMTGLKVADDYIVSVGFVPIIQGEVHLAQAQHLLLETDHEMGTSATIHHIRDQDVQGGMDVIEAVSTLLDCLKGRILIAHHAPLDIAFLDHVIKHHFGVPFKPLLIDTMELEKARLLKRESVIKEGDLRLFNCRRRYHLPDMLNHNALGDAIATAELFLAQLSGKGPREKLKLKAVLG